MKNKFTTIFIAVFAFTIFGCQPNAAILNSQRGSQEPQAASNNENVERPQDEFEFALKRMQKSGFTHIFVIRRNDGAVLEKEDKSYIKLHAPSETNQFVLTDKERAVIAGSNFPFPSEALENLRKKLSVEDASPTNSSEANANQQTDNR